ncbi:MAG: hypothetical protein MUF12_01620 [Sediminibacterium sp.]|nr:hypothetical protein [Sediminibacterium sp.]
MKSFIFLFTILFGLSSGIFAQQKDKAKAPVAKSVTPNKYKDNVDQKARKFILEKKAVGIT